jgi:hypothetical protein
MQLEGSPFDEHLVHRITKRASESLRRLPDEDTPLAASDKLSLYADACKRVSSVALRTEKIQELLATYSRPSKDAAARLPRDCKLWRQVTLASELYECSRNGLSHALHAQFDVPGTYNQLLRQLPPFYEIDTVQLTTALTEVTKDSTLAKTIAENFASAAETYQFERLYIQSKLNLSSSAMEAIEQRLPLHELAQIIQDCQDADLVVSLLSRTVKEHRPELDTIEHLRDWATKLRAYWSQLSALERLAPGISPLRNPELFFDPPYFSKAREHLEAVRADPAAQCSLYRLVAFSRMEDILSISPTGSRGNFILSFAVLLTYGFGTRSRSEQDSNTTFELTTQAYGLFTRDMARIAPEVVIPKQNSVAFETTEMLDSLVYGGMAKHPLSPQGPIRNEFILSPSVRGSQNWPDVVKLVNILRSGKQTPERLLQAEPQTAGKKMMAPASAKRTSSAALSSGRFDKLHRDLKKSLKTYEAALEELPGITKEHLQRKQLALLMSTAARIAEIHAKLEDVSLPPGDSTRIRELIIFLKPPHSPEDVQTVDFMRMAKTSLHLLQRTLISTPSNSEGA